MTKFQAGDGFVCFQCFEPLTGCLLACLLCLFTVYSSSSTLNACSRNDAFKPECISKRFRRIRRYLYRMFSVFDNLNSFKNNVQKPKVGRLGQKRFNLTVASFFGNFLPRGSFFEDNFQRRHARTKMFPEISRWNFWYNKNFRKKNSPEVPQDVNQKFKCSGVVLYFEVTMIVLILFTRPHNALVSSNTNLGKKLPKNDATITRKNDDATVKL